MDKIVKTPTVTFRYQLSTKVQLHTNGSSSTYSKLAKTLKDINQFLTKEELLKSDHALLQRLVYKFSSQLRHFKSFKNLKRVNHYLTKFQTFLTHYAEESTHLSESSSQEQTALFLPSRQMLEYFLAKSMQLSFVLRKIVLFSMTTFNACLSSLHRAELTGAHLLFTSLSSRIWIIARTVILKIVDWYDDLILWLPHLKGTDAECLNGFELADELKAWLDGKCPVEDDPNLVEKKPTEADGVLARFTAGDEVDLEVDLDDIEEKGQDSAESQGESTGSENEVAMSVARKTRSRTSRSKVSEASMQEEISQPGTSHAEDLGVVVKRKMFPADETGRSSPRRQPGDEDGPSPAKRRKNGDNSESNTPTTKKKKIKNGNALEHAEANGATSQPEPTTPASNGTQAEPTPSSSNSSNGVFAVPKKHRKAVAKKSKPGLSKTEYKNVMKAKLKKPSLFLEELSHSSLELGKELVVLPRIGRHKLIQELTVILRQFNNKKNQVSKQTGEQKSQTMKQVKKLRLAFKRHARDSLWKLIQEK